MSVKKKKQYSFPIHLKLLGTTLFFLLLLTLAYGYLAFVCEKECSRAVLEEKKHLIDSAIIVRYQELSETAFLEYTNTDVFVDLLLDAEISNLLLINSENKVIYSNYPEQITNQISSDMLNEHTKANLKNAGSKLGIATKYFEKQGVYDYTVYLKKHNKYDGIIYASIGLARFRNEMSTILSSSTIISLLVIIASVLFFISFSKKLTRPIRELNEVATKVASGDFDCKVNFSSNDELGSLASTFNAMIEKLREYHNIQLDQIQMLNEELMQKNMSLEANFSELEATNEELETTNEELIATNEELGMANKDLFAMANELKSSKEKLEENIEMVEAVNEDLKVINSMKSNFLGMASHELKTPLVMIKGYAELILDSSADNLSNSSNEMVTHILKGANLLDAIIRDMLDITKIEAKELKLNLNKVELEMIINTAMFEMNGIAKERTQTLTALKPPSVRVCVDSPQLHRVIIHLITNAIKFTPDEGKITVSAEIVSDHVLSSMFVDEDVDQAVDISIADSGIGIDKSEQKRIFDVFYEIGDINHHRSSKVAYLGKGSGLGLPICKGIIEAHKGRIWVESPGSDMEKFPGSTFHIVLPLPKEESFAKGEVTVVTEDVSEQELPAKKQKILLIEDEIDIVELTEMVLRSKYTLEAVDNGADGIKKAFSFKPDLILLDIYMKGLNGFEVCAILKENEVTKNIPIAMFTAGTQTYEVEKGYEAGVDDYITKPFKPRELLDRIEALLQKEKSG